MSVQVNGGGATTATLDEGGLPVRPGDALVPGLRRLRGAGGRPGLHAGARDPARADRVHHRHRLRRPLRLLHGHLRDARHPRPRAGARDRPGDHAARPLDLGRHRRRRRALDRRQPPDPRAAPQRAGQDPAVQQPDLRADEGPGVADERARQGHEVDAVRHRTTSRSTRSRSRSARRRRSSRARSTATSSTSPTVLRAAAAHQGAALVEIYQNCPVFNDGAFDALHRPSADAERNQIRLEHGEPIRFGAEGERGVARAAPTATSQVVDVADVGEDALLVHDAHRADPSLAFALARLAERPTGPTPIGIFRAVERPLHGAAAAPQRRAARRATLARAREPAASRRHVDCRLTAPASRHAASSPVHVRSTLHRPPASPAVPRPCLTGAGIRQTATLSRPYDSRGEDPRRRGRDGDRRLHPARAAGRRARRLVRAPTGSRGSGGRWARTSTSSCST